jgi:signal-transduction protein with cAMP-binding, CBS, and nucleotidyltransferase domain
MYLLKVKECAKSGSVIIQEGKPSSIVVIVKEGSVEVTKRNMEHIHMNTLSGII